MELKYKPDFTQAKKYWNAFWEKEIIDRPLLITETPKDSLKQISPPQYMNGIEGDFQKAIEEFEEYAENTYFACESIPYLPISFGPDMFSYFLKGAEKKVKIESNTAWIEPFVNKWEEFPPLELDRKNFWYKRYLDFYKYAGEKGNGKFLLEMADFHTHLDCLRAIRGSSQLCLDLIDNSEEIEKRLIQIRQIFPIVYNDIYKMGNMEKCGTIGWIPFYCEKKYATIQCDFICMIGKEMFRKFALPSIEEEANFLDHCIYHLDGIGALNHLDDLLTIEKIDAIQWVPGAGKGTHKDWIDILEKIHKKGKSLIIYPSSIDEIKIFHKELGPERIVYQIKLKTLKEVEEIKNWLIKNT